MREAAQYLIMLLALLTIQHPVATRPHTPSPAAEAVTQEMCIRDRFGRGLSFCHSGRGRP